MEVNGTRLQPGRRGSDWGPITLLSKTKEFFQTCDVEGKGFITRTDMRVRNRVCALGKKCEKYSTCITISRRLGC